MDYFIRPYPLSPNHGFWGPPTSTIDWCEENYVVSQYIAEWSNTLTNSFFIMLALYVIYSANYNNLEARFKVIGFGFGLVGVGSSLFHMTLQYRYQLLDELPMVYVTCIPAWSIFCDQLIFMNHSLSVWKEILVGICVFMGANILTWIYLVYKNPTIHQAGYAVINLIVITLALSLTSKCVKNPKHKKNLHMIMILGISLFFTGYIAWLLDIHFCSVWIYLRRNYLRLPLGVTLELHGWWHLLTGAGVYFWIIYLEYLRILMHGKENRYILIWRWKVLPEVIQIDKSVGGKHSLEFLGPSELMSHELKKHM